MFIAPEERNIYKSQLTVANTYSQIYIHTVFAVKGRQSLISDMWKQEVYKYITGIVKNKNQKLIAINGVADHIHILLGLRSSISLSDILRDIKANSSRFINERGWVAGRFEWQTGFGAFSCSHSQLTDVIKYIENQENHHRKKTLRDEYVCFLKNNNIEYNDEYLFEDVAPTEL